MEEYLTGERARKAAIHLYALFNVAAELDLLPHLLLAAGNPEGDERWIV